MQRIQLSRAVLPLSVLAVALAGCGEQTAGGAPPADRPAYPRVIADQGTLPDEEAYEYAAIAPDSDELAIQWARFGLNGSPPDVDLDAQVVLFVGFGESGSCGYEYGGIAIDVEAKRLTFVDAAEPRQACTDDYNPRTLTLTVDRNSLPDGVFQVEPPSGAAVSVAAEQVEQAPQEEPDVVSASISDVFVELDPEPVPTDGRLAVGVRNETDQRVATPRTVRLDRWTGLGFEPAGQRAYSADDDIVTAEPGTTEHLLDLDIAASGLAPGWYRITVDLDVTTGDYGRLLIRRAVEVE